MHYQNKALSSGVTVSVHRLLKIAIAMCFIGHGAFGIITKAVWCSYFAVFGIGEHTAYLLMPYVGVADIVLGIIMLVYPIRAIALWLVFWGLFTASLRPLSGEPFAEFLERAGNYGVPLVLLVLAGGWQYSRGRWFKRMQPDTYPPVQVETLINCLRVVVFLLLLGHGWLNLLYKPGLLNQYKSLGWGDGVQVAQIVGFAEITGALLVLVKPLRPVVLLLFAWKVTSETFYPSHPFFEWVERGGSYAAIFCLWLLLGYQQQPAQSEMPKLRPAV